MTPRKPLDARAIPTNPGYSCSLTRAACVIVREGVPVKVNPRGSTDSEAHKIVISTNPNRELLDIGETATYLACSERFIRRLVQERRIPFVKLGGTRIKFLIRDLDDWIAAQRIERVR